METQKPNLFKIATKELSHDAVITWLLQWASPKVKDLNPALHECGNALLHLLLSQVKPDNPITLVQTGRQWENIDIWVKLYYENGEKLFLIIENKIFAEEHSNQLERYKAIAQQWATEHGFSLECLYVKIGSQPLKLINQIAAKGYKVIDRNRILDCLNSFPNINDTIITDYRDFLQHIEDGHQSYNVLKIKDWHDWSWIGFYQYVETQMEINMWHFVNNPGGGFWNMSLNWGYWGHFPIYIQIEQGKMCYKIALADYETGADNSKTDVNRVQDFVHSELLRFAEETGVKEIQRPYPFVHRGAYRTIAIVEQDYWLGQGDTLVDKTAVINNLQRHIDFYKAFMAHLNAMSYTDANLEVVELPEE